MKRKKEFFIFILGGFFFYLISFIVPKKRNLWIFGAWEGMKYSDNSKYLFEYINKHDKKIICIWLAKNKRTIEIVRSNGFKAYHAYSIKGIILSIRAKVAFVTTNLFDITEFTIGKIKIVLLWHGTPLKKISYDNIFVKPSKLRKYLNSFFPFWRQDFSKYAITSTANTVSRSFSTAFKVPIENIMVTGYPRNDVLFSKENTNSKIMKTIRSIKSNHYKIGIYMPTWRPEKYSIAKILQNDIESLNKNLEKLKTVLLIKLHFMDLQLINDLKTDYSNIIFIKDEDIQQDIYPVLPHTDFLITDYSSVYFDYLLLNKPIIFTPFDMDDYLKDRDFYYDYKDVTPGPIAKNWDDVINAIKDINDNPKLYEKERLKINDMFNKFKDGNSSQRIYEQVIKFI